MSEVRSRSDAGRLGALEVAKRHGRAHYEKMGRAGGQRTLENNGVDFFRAIGRKSQDACMFTAEHMAEIGRRGGKKGTQARIKYKERCQELEVENRMLRDLLAQYQKGAE